MKLLRKIWWTISGKKNTFKKIISERAKAERSRQRDFIVYNVDGSETKMKG